MLAASSAPGRPARPAAAGPAGSGSSPTSTAEVVVHRLALDRFDEVHLGRLLAVQLAVEEIDHDLAREPLRRGLAGPSSLKIWAQVRMNASFSEL